MEKKNYYEWKVATAKASYHMEMHDCNKWAAENTTDPMLKKRYYARMYAQKRLVRKYKAMAYQLRNRKREPHA